MGKKSKPFDGAITTFFESDAASDLRRLIIDRGPKDILTESYPYPKRMKGSAYDAQYDALQIELVKLQTWLRETDERLVVVFEGRDAAGKGGAIKRVRENLNPRHARVVALSKPSDTEMGQWYFQRYVSHLPSKGEMVLFDRSWYNRAVVENVFGFCDDAQRETFFAQTPQFEKMLTDDGIKLIKIWLNVGRAEQLRRFLAREADPLKGWKLSPIDVKGLAKWNAYSKSITEMFDRTHQDKTPWTVIRSDDKRRARIAVMKRVLSAFDYADKDSSVAESPDAKICGGPDMLVLDG